MYQLFQLLAGAQLHAEAARVLVLGEEEDHPSPFLQGPEHHHLHQILGSQILREM